MKAHFRRSFAKTPTAIFVRGETAMITTDLVGRVERMRLAPRNALVPLFEAVSNSIDAICARTDARKGVIEVHLLRDPTQGQMALHAENVEPISELRIVDNGVGFTADNMTAFQRLDTRFKIAFGGKGVGRLTWLKVFDKITVTSVYQDATGYRKRAFDFTLPDGVENLLDTIVNDRSPRETSTTVILYRPKDPYRDTMRHRTETIAASLARHFLYYLLGQAPPEIKVIDGETIVPLSTNNVIARDTGHFAINDHQFAIDHIKLRSPLKAQHSVNYCANHRPVKEERLKHLPEHKFDDGQDGFFYQAYVSSPYLDACVDEQRTTLVLDEEPGDFGVSESEVRAEVNAAANRFLSKELGTLTEEKEKRIERIIDTNIPELRYVREFNRDEVFAKITFDNTDAEVQTIISNIHLENQKTGRELMADLVRNLQGQSSLT